MQQIPSPSSFFHAIATVVDLICGSPEPRKNHWRYFLVGYEIPNTFELGAELYRYETYIHISVAYKQLLPSAYETDARLSLTYTFERGVSQLLAGSHRLSSQRRKDLPTTQLKRYILYILSFEPYSSTRSESRLSSRDKLEWRDSRSSFTMISSPFWFVTSCTS